MDYNGLQPFSVVIINRPFQFYAITKLVSIHSCFVNMNCLNGCMFHKMSTFRQHDQFTDVVFILGGARLKAHKTVLSCRSDVFEVMFTSPMTETNCGEVVITDASKEVFEVFLDYLYLNTLDSKTLEKHHEELLYLSQKYFIKGLKNICVMEIERSVATGNMFYLLKLADCYNIKSLAKKAVDAMPNLDEEYFEPKDWDQLSSNSRISKTVLSNLAPSTISLSWVGSLNPHGTRQYGQDQYFTIRNNGNRVQGKIELLYSLNTVHIVIKLLPPDDGGWDRPFEISYQVKVYGVTNSIKGNHWWPSVINSSLNSVRIQAGELRRILCVFEYDLKVHDISDTMLFNVELTQWNRPNKVFKNLDHPGPPKPLDSGNSASSTITPSVVDVAELNSTVAHPFSKRITRSTQKKLRRCWSGGAMPSNAEVDVTLMYAASQNSCTDLLRHCETVFASRLTVCNAVDTLILAIEMNLAELKSKTVEFISLNHKETMATYAWRNLEKHPNIVATILKKVLSKPPDFEPISNEPFPEVILPGDYYIVGGDADGGHYFSSEDDEYY